MDPHASRPVAAANIKMIIPLVNENIQTYHSVCVVKKKKKDETSIKAGTPIIMTLSSMKSTADCVYYLEEIDGVEHMIINGAKNVSNVLIFHALI